MKETVPEYVFDLLKAFLSNEPLDFKNHQVPVPVQEFLEKAKVEGLLKGVWK